MPRAASRTCDALLRQPNRLPLSRPAHTKQARLDATRQRIAGKNTGVIGTAAPLPRRSRVSNPGGLGGLGQQSIQALPASLLGERTETHVQAFGVTLVPGCHHRELPVQHRLPLRDACGYA